MYTPRVVKKVAFYIDYKRVTDFVYDDGKAYNEITIMQRENTIEVFDNKTGRVKAVLQNVFSFDVIKDSIITYNGLEYSAWTLNGKNILPPIYLKIQKHDSYFIVTTKTRKVGVYKWEKKSLIEIIPPEEFIGVQLHLAGINVVKESEGKLYRGFYSYAGKEVISPRYKEVNFNSSNIYVITHENKYGMFTYEGKQIIPPEYDFVKLYKNCYIVGIFDSKEYKYGLYTKEGKQVLKARYDRYEIESPFVYFTIGFKKSVYNLNNGKRILPLRYEIIHKYYDVIYGTENYSEFFIHSSKTGKKLLEESYECIHKAMPYVLVLKKKSKVYYYLTKYNKLLDAHDYTVKYDEEDKKIYVRKLWHNKKDEILFKTEWELYSDE